MATKFPEEEPPTLVEYLLIHKKKKKTREEEEESHHHHHHLYVVREAVSVFRLSFPIAVTALLFYSRSVLSMVFLGSLGELPLAAGSLALAFANITGYSVLSGLSLGMEPLCSQAHGARQSRMMSLTLHRSVLFLLCSSLPISLLWINMSSILSGFLGQDEEITALSQTYLLYSLPDLVSFSFIHPIRIYLRSQGITTPLTVTASLASLVHVPFNLLFVTKFGLGAAGVAAAGAASNLSLLLFLCLYLYLFSTSSNSNSNSTNNKTTETTEDEEKEEEEEDYSSFSFFFFFGGSHHDHDIYFEYAYEEEGLSEWVGSPGPPCLP